VVDHILVGTDVETDRQQADIHAGVERAAVLVVLPDPGGELRFTS
jgi:hypothetical protein